jgi:hypothetical protein
MGELIPLWDQCEGCAADEPSGSQAHRAEGTQVFCSSCGTRLRRGLFSLLPPTHQAYVVERLEAAAVAEARDWLRHSEAGAIAARARATQSEVGVRYLSRAVEDVEALAQRLGAQHSTPELDARVQWLLKEIATKTRLRQRAVDDFRRDRGWIKPSKAKRDPKGIAAVEPGARYLTADEHVLERGGDDPTFYSSPQTPEDELLAREGEAAALGLHLMLSLHFGDRDDAVTVFRLLVEHRLLADEIGRDRPGRGTGMKLPNDQISVALEASAADRHWDNKPWTVRRVENARDKIVRLCLKLPSDADERRFKLVRFWAEYCRRNPTKP